MKTMDGGNQVRSLTAVTFHLPELFTHNDLVSFSSLLR
jgi:hypothetical protein